jgi:exodeoxyribonuclease VII large subunit
MEQGKELGKHWGSALPVWRVGALCRAIADALESRFNPVRVSGEITGFTRAASGHCYFSIKDDAGQLRCAMFKRAASMLGFMPRDGELVELQGRLGVYEPRGELQLIVETLTRAGQGAMFEQFMRLKAQLEAQGLFDAQRKRPLPAMPRAIGVVTSLGAAALHDVATALQRRVPHIPVVLAPASVQGMDAPAELVRALESLYAGAEGRAPWGVTMPVDVILLVRGGGSLEDLWAFNDETLAHVLARSPVPVVCGVGHETDFTIADFVADVRAPTPTAAAELAAVPASQLLDSATTLAQSLTTAVQRHCDRLGQQLDDMQAHMGRPSQALLAQRTHGAARAQALRHAWQLQRQRKSETCARLAQALPKARNQAVQRAVDRLDQLESRLTLLNPHRVLQRGYAWLQDPQGRTVASVTQVHAGQALQATLQDGMVAVHVASTHAN